MVYYTIRSVIYSTHIKKQEPTFTGKLSLKKKIKKNVLVVRLEE